MKTAKLERWIVCQSLRDSLRIAHDDSWMATRRYVHTTPHRTATGRHFDPMGTKSSRQPKYTYVSAHNPMRCRPTATMVSTPRNLCRSSSQAGTPRRRMSRVDKASPHRMLALASAHATTPAERATYQAR